MYKGTRHTGRTWSYKANTVGSPSFDTNDQCRAMVSKCKDTFTPLQLLGENDFEKLDFTRLSEPPARVVGHRLRQGREKLEKLGVPQRLIFAAPAFLLIAPKLGGLLGRLSRKNVEDVPVELRDLYWHVRQNGLAELSRPSPSPVEGDPKTLYHVAKDGTRTAFKSSTFRRSGPKALLGTKKPDSAPHARAVPASSAPQPVKAARNTALSATFERALAKGEPKKSRG